MGKLEGYLRSSQAADPASESHMTVVMHRMAARSAAPGIARVNARTRELLEGVVRQNVVIAEPVLLSAATPDRIKTCLH